MHYKQISLSATTTLCSTYFLYLLPRWSVVQVTPLTLIKIETKVSPGAYKHHAMKMYTVEV
jgi:hypothetical protein